MRATRILTAVNWKYAIGELILIVTGILIALAANSWYESRKSQHEEIQVLNQIRQSLEEDHQILLERKGRLERFLARAKDLYEDLRSSDSWDDESIELLNTINAIAPWQVQTAPFEALRSRGLELISDDSLRIQLVALYDDLYVRARRNVDSDTAFVYDRIRPYLLEHFLRDPTDRWIARDIEKVRAEGYLANLTKMRSYSLETFTIPAMARAIEANRELSVMIDAVVVREK